MQQLRFILRNGFTLHVSGDNLTHHEEYICCIWNPNVHYRIHKCPPPLPILSQLHPVSTPSHFLKIHRNIVFPSASGSTQWSLSLGFPHYKPVHTSPLPHTRHMPRPPHSSRFYHPHNIGYGVKIPKLLLM